MLALLAILFGLSGLAGPSSAQSDQAGEVDVELVIAVDVSRSMDFEEIRIQREGYVAAIRHPDFINAVRSGLIGRIAISYYEWAGTVDPQSVVDWQIVETEADAERFAAMLEARPVSGQRRTSISAAIAEGTAMILANRFQGMRQVIDVSGDGPNNAGAPVTMMRDRAFEAGIVVNGLAIMLRPSGMPVGLDLYYGDCVITGPGSFILPVYRIEDFAVAVRRKLVMEISGTTPPPAIRKVADRDIDCLIGERQWRNFLDR